MQLFYCGTMWIPYLTYHIFIFAQNGTKNAKKWNILIFSTTLSQFEEVCYRKTTKISSKKPTGYRVDVEGLHYFNPRKS